MIKINWDKYIGSTKGEKIWNILTSLDMCMFYNFFFYTVLYMTSDDRFDLACWSLVFVYNSWCTVAYHSDPEDFALPYQIFLKEMFYFFILKYSKFLISMFIVGLVFYLFYDSYYLILLNKKVMIKALGPLNSFIFEIARQIFTWGGFFLCIHISYWVLFLGMKDISNAFTLDYFSKIKIITGIQISICILMISLSLFLIAFGIIDQFPVETHWIFGNIQAEAKINAIILGCGFLGICLSLFTIFLILNFRFKELNKGVA
jgi:hypothetical protein